MKKLRFVLALVFALLAANYSVKAQVNDDNNPPATDPLLKYRKVTSVSIMAGINKLNHSETDFNLENDFIYLNKQLPALEMFISNGRIFKNKDTSSVSGILRWSFGIRNRQAALLQNKTTEYRYKEVELFVEPFTYKVRMGLNRKISKNRYNAIEAGIGPYISAPFTTDFYIADNKNFPSKEESVALNTFRLGLVWDIALSFLNEKAHGDVVGGRMSIDLVNIANGKSDVFNKAPLFFSTGIYYNFVNGAR